MSHDLDPPADGTTAAITDPGPAPRGEPEFLARARRILGGDIRPDDYLPVTSEVEARVARDLAFAADHIRQQFQMGRIPAAFEIDPSVAIRQRNEWLLSLYYGGQNIAYIENDTGVIVLAVGLERGGVLLDAFPYELRKGVAFGAPLLPDTILML